MGVRAAGLPRVSHAVTASIAYEPTGTTRCLPPLPESSTRALLEVEVVDVEADRLGDAGPGAVQHFQQCPRAQAGGRSGLAEGAAAASSRSTCWTGKRLRQAASECRWADGASDRPRSSPSRWVKRCSPRTATRARAADERGERRMVVVAGTQERRGSRRSATRHLRTASLCTPSRQIAGSAAGRGGRPPCCWRRSRARPPDGRGSGGWPSATSLSARSDVVTRGTSATGDGTARQPRVTCPAARQPMQVVRWRLCGAPLPALEATPRRPREVAPAPARPGRPRRRGAGRCPAPSRGIPRRTGHCAQTAFARIGLAQAPVRCFRPGRTDPGRSRRSAARKRHAAASGSWPGSGMPCCHEAATRSERTKSLLSPAVAPAHVGQTAPAVLMFVLREGRPGTIRLRQLPLVHLH